jgi:predicted nucleic acid-binding protein
MYLLDSQQVMDLLSRDKDRAIFRWIEQTEPARGDLFVSVLSLGQVAATIERMLPTQRNHWRRLLQEGRRELEEAGSIVDVDMPIVEAWQSNLRGDLLGDIEDAHEDLAEDDRLIVATAIARNYTLVTESSRVIDEIARRTSLTTVEP